MSRSEKRAIAFHTIGRDFLSKRRKNRKRTAKSSRRPFLTVFSLSIKPFRRTSPLNDVLMLFRVLNSLGHYSIDEKNPAP